MAVLACRCVALFHAANRLAVFFSLALEILYHYSPDSGLHSTYVEIRHLTSAPTPVIQLVCRCIPVALCLHHVTIERFHSISLLLLWRYSPFSPMVKLGFPGSLSIQRRREGILHSGTSKTSYGLVAANFLENEGC